MQTESKALPKQEIDTENDDQSNTCAVIDSNNNLETSDAQNDANVSRFQMRRGRKSRRIGNKVDIKAKLERSRQSARECRARKKLRYQYLEDLVVKRENANVLLKKELEMFREMCKKRESDAVMAETPDELNRLDEEKRKNNRRA